MSLTFGLQVALSGLRAQQFGLNVTGNNIANASTEGYRRQDVLLEPGMVVNGAWAAGGQGSTKLGTGVEIAGIRRMQSDYLDNQVRNSNQSSGTWNAKSDSLSQVEALMGEPGDSGIASVMDKFWSSWEELATSPESAAAKAAVTENGNELAQRIQSLYGDFQKMQFQLDDGVKSNVSEINRIGHQIAELNADITKTSNGGAQPNDLMDRRDMLLDDLSKIVKFQVTGKSGQEMMLTINGKTLVQGTHMTEVETDQLGGGWTTVKWSDDNTPLVPTGGELMGQMDTRDHNIQQYMDQLDILAQNIVSSVNSVYQFGRTATGFGAGDFFNAGTGASDMAVSANLLNNPGCVVTSYTGDSGDNAMALDISALKNKPVVPGGGTLNDTYNTLVSQIAAHTSEAKSQSTTQGLSQKQLLTQRDSVSGVSLDEEMVNMIKFQQTYNACARVVTTIDDMIDTMINKMGTVGR